MSVLLVTGGSRGIGAEIARRGAAGGYAVAVNYTRNRDAADAVVREIEGAGGRAAAIQADVADPEAIEKLFDEAQSQIGPVTALVNNAGVTGPVSRLADASAETVRQVIDLNVTGLILCCRAAARRMATGAGGPGGAIVNLSSGAATLGSAGSYVWYAASKAAVDTLTVGLAKELAADGIRVNSVQPGPVETDIHADAGDPERGRRMGEGTPIGRPGTVEEIADAVLFLLSAKSSYTTGAILRVTGGH